MEQKNWLEEALEKMTEEKNRKIRLYELSTHISTLVNLEMHCFLPVTKEMSDIRWYVVGKLKEEMSSILEKQKNAHI